MADPAPGGTGVNIAWVVTADHDFGVGADLSVYHDIGPVWGSWASWRACGTHNVICHEHARCQELLQRGLHQQCNFFMPQQHYASLGRPQGVQLYDGDYKQDTLGLEDVIACHLASSAADLVLMMGFDFRKPEPMEDRLAAHRLRNRLGLLRQHMVNTDHVQWVLVDHPGKPDRAFRDLANVTQERLENVIAMLGQQK